MVVYTSWIEQANCRGADPEIFFPDRGGSNQVEEARRMYCNPCPVQAECLAYAMTCERSMPGYHTYGIYGGVGPARRKQIKAERSKSRAPAR